MNNAKGQVGTVNLTKYDGISVKNYNVDVFSTGSYFRASVISGSHIDISTETQIPEASYTVLLVVTADVDYVTITNVVSVTVTVSQTTTVVAKDVVLFLPDGMYKSSVVDCVQNRTGFRDLSYKFHSTDPDFDISPDGVIFCSRDMFIDSIANDNSIAVEKHFSVTISKNGVTKDLAHYTILIFRQTYRRDLDENKKYSIAQFSKSDHFNFSSDDLPVRKFKLLDGFVLVSQLNYEENKQFHFTIKITSKSGTMERTVDINIKVNDLNDESPAFTKNVFYFHTLSHAPAGTVVGAVVATDPDTVRMHYKIEETSDVGDIFKIEESTGVITLKKYLITSGSSVNITVVVCDNVSCSRHDSADVVMYLKTVQTNVKNLNYSFEGTVKETAAVGSFVTSVSVSGYTGYIFPDITSSQLYLLNSTSGHVTLKKKLDWEKRAERENQYAVQGYRVGKDQCFFDNIGTVTLTVEDMNDHYPQFNSFSAGTVQENCATGTTVFFTKVIKVSDLDSPLLSKITFSLSGSDSDKFSVSTLRDNIAVITVTGQIDREVNNIYTLQLKAVDGMDSDKVRHTATATVQINVEDINDNSPTFAQTFYSVTITENSHPGSVVTVKASDRDSGLNGKITYRIVSGAKGYFSIDETSGEMRTTQEIDREQHSRFLLSIVAADSGQPSLMTTATVTVTVDDVNDNDPVLENVKTVWFDENKACSSPIVTIKVTDADVGANGDVTLSTDNSKFQIDQSGNLRCVSPLDYEGQSSHSVNITARDHGQPSRSTEAVITVSVNDVNDNSPQFSAPDYSVNISTLELRADKPVIVIDAFDHDSGDNGRITFSFSDESMFYINTTNNVGIVRVKTNGHQSSANSYSITVTATDHGQLPLTSQTTLSIHVRGETSSLVKFEKNDFVFTVKEDSRDTNQKIGRVEAIYNMSEVTVQYSLPEMFKINFTINNRTGEVFCGSLLDREKQAFYHIVVRVCSTRNKNDGDVALIKIQVLDINDNSPTFIEPANRLVFEVPENKVRELVGRISATDKDEGDNATIVYSISEDDQPFQINPETSELTVTTPLDYETQKQYKLTIVASDKGTPRLSTSVTVTVDVTDVNDNSPVFFRSQNSVTVSESVLVSSEVFRVNASDADSGRYGELTFEIENNTMFSIDTEISADSQYIGVIKLKEQLDYETTKTYQVTVVVYDDPEDATQRHSATANVEVSVSDVNDNAPVFVGAPYMKTVPRDTALQTTIFNNSVVKATDADSGENGNIHFSLSGDGTKYFGIQSETGILTLSTSLQDASDFIYMTLIATDGGQPSLSAVTSIQINISDDNPSPWFEKAYAFSLVEESDPARFAGKVEASDRSPAGQTVTCDCHYQLSSESRKYFTIDEKTGELSQTKTIDRERTGSIMYITMTATDNGEPPKSSDTTVTINIIDIDDNLPHFSNSQQHQQFNVSQNATVGTLVGVVTYTDEDTPENSAVSMTLISDVQLFNISNDGKIYTSHSLFANIKDDYVVPLRILVTSAHNKRAETNFLCHVNITVVYISNNTPPKFSKELYHQSISFETKKNSKFDLKIRTTDLQNDSVSYKIETKIPRDVFRLDEHNADVVVQYDIDDTIPDNVTFRISAVDNNEVPKTSYAMVEIQILGRQPTECLLKSETEALRNDRQEKTIYLSLFAALAAILAASVVLSVFFLYKWRVAANKKNDTAQEFTDISQYTAPKHDSQPTYEQLHGSHYDRLKTTDFTSPEGVQNPAYASSSSLTHPHQV